MFLTSKNYYELANKDVFVNWLKNIKDKSPAVTNMYSLDWENNPSTLLYILEKTDRFLNIGFDIWFHKNEIVGCSGMYISEFSMDFVLAGVRTYINPKYRHLSLNKDYFWVKQKEWAVTNNIKAIGLTFNDYNKNIIEIFKRNRLGEKNDRLSNRKPYNLFFNGITEVKFPVTIQYTKQWIIYEKLDQSFTFDWQTIKY